MGDVMGSSRLLVRNLLFYSCLLYFAEWCTKGEIITCEHVTIVNY